MELVKKFGKRTLRSIPVIGLFMFMLFIFLPAEVLYANTKELPFVYGEFSKDLTILAVGITVAASLIISFLPDIIHRWLLTALFGIDLGAYVQYMFLNKGIDLMGQNPLGYNPPTNKIVTNIIIWIVILIVVIALEIITKKGKVALCGALFIFAIQGVAMVSIIMGADDAFFEYPATEYHLSGEEQYTVSSDENIILFVVDCFSNRDLNNALAVKPDAIDMLNDFTRYTNEDAVYLGTFPSLDHMLTTEEVDFDKKINDWTKSVWTSDNCNYFYKGMKDAGYECNLYTPDLTILCAENSPEDLLADKWDNFTNAPLRREVDKKAIKNGVLKMAAYRIAPEFLKGRYYVTMSDYIDTVKILDDPLMHENYDFNSKLLENELVTKDDKKMFIVQHLMGTHLFKNDEYGNYKEEAGYEETALGCLNILHTYINDLKKVGAYDNSTIIITADHGWEYGQQPVFFVKEAGRENDKMEESDAPISHCELLPTIAEYAGMDPSPLGKTIYDFKPGEKRTRTLYIKNYFEEYPDVPTYDGSKTGSDNVHVGYTYTGDENELLKYLFDNPSEVIPMVDAYF